MTNIWATAASIFLKLGFINDEQGCKVSAKSLSGGRTRTEFKPAATT